MNRRRNPLILLFLLATSSVLLFSCAQENLENISSPVDCDTTSVTYSGSVEPIISSRCEGCHNAVNPNGGVQLTTHTHVSNAASNGSLLGVIRHENGWPAMPKGGNKLNDCDIAKIEIWIEQGMPNN